jgi:hypothetical protein
MCESEVKLLGVTIDCQLKFNTHISEICKRKKKASVFIIVYNVLCLIADDRGHCSTLKTCVNK